LRNVEKTAPYMHDGSKATLYDVVSHYNSGGNNHVNKNNLITPLGLTQDEMNDLIAFLKTLTDESFINNPFFKNN
jgi:cytochrome c peroxidase